MFPLSSLFNLGGPDLLIIFLIGIPFIIWMVVDCLNREPNEGNSKVVWLLVILLAPFGSLIYFFGRKLPRKATRQGTVDCLRRAKGST